MEADQDDHSLRAAYEGMCRSLHAAFERTRNPLYVWQAIAAAGRFAQHEAMFDAEVADPFAAPPLPLPDWVLPYLVHVAGRMAALADLRPLKLPPDVDLTKEADRAALCAWREEQISTDDARYAVAEALYLVRQGWSAFAAYQSDRRKDQVEDEWNYHRARMGDQAAVEALQDLLGFEDARSVRRLLQQALARRTKPTS